MTNFYVQSSKDGSKFKPFKKAFKEQKDIILFYLFEKYLKLSYVDWSSRISKGKYTKSHWNLRRYNNQRRGKKAISSFESSISLLCHSRIRALHERCS